MGARVRAPVALHARSATARENERAGEPEGWAGELLGLCPCDIEIGDAGHAARQTTAAEQRLAEKAGKADYRLNVSQEQRWIQAGKEAQLKGMFKKEQKGVKVKSSQ